MLKQLESGKQILEQFPNTSKAATLLVKIALLDQDIADDLRKHLRGKWDTDKVYDYLSGHRVKKAYPAIIKTATALFKRSSVETTKDVMLKLGYLISAGDIWPDADVPTKKDSVLDKLKHMLVKEAEYYSKNLPRKYASAMNFIDRIPYEDLLKYASKEVTVADCLYKWAQLGQDTPQEFSNIALLKIALVSLTKKGKLTREQSLKLYNKIVGGKYA